MKKIKNLNGYAIYQAGPRDVKKYGFEDGSFYVYFASDVRDFGLPNSTPEFEGCGSLEEAEANCAGNFAIAKEIVEGRTTAASMEEILEVEAQLDAGADPDDLDELTEHETIADIIADEFPGMDPEQNKALAAAMASIKPDADPEWVKQFIASMKRAAEVLAEFFRKAVETVKRIADALAKTFRQHKDEFMDAAMLAASPPPKWWHLYKHAKKARVRKKYRGKLMDNLLATLQAAGTI
jgi:hypothetical protein